MKKKITIIALICVLVCMFSMNVFADVVFDANTKAIVPGTEVIITVTSDEAVGGLLGIQYNFEYDETVFEFVSMESAIFDKANPKNGRYPLAKFDMGNEVIVPEGVIATITLRALDTVEDGVQSKVKLYLVDAIEMDGTELVEGDEKYEALKLNNGTIELGIHIHDYATPNYDETNHWMECECGDKTAVEEHDIPAHDCVTPAQCIGCDYVEDHGDHKPYTVPAVAPTCGEPGLTEGTKCEICDIWLIKQETIESLPHENLKPIVDRAPTCTELGFVDAAYCRDCGKIVALEMLPALGHDENVTPGQKPTCTEPGTADRIVCNRCDEVISVGGDVLPATGHTPQVVPGDAPTCTEPGTADRTVCSTCDELLGVGSEVPPATGHTAQVVPGKPATCIETGLTDGEKCAVCEIELKAQEVIPVVDHKWSTDYTTDANNHWYKCTVEGCTATSKPVAHKGGTASCTEQAKCEDCGVSYGKLAAHTATEIVFDGKGHWYKCVNCDYTTDRETHAMKNAGRENEVPATCYAKGSYVEVAKCACGYETRETKSVPMIEHNWAAATCTAPKTCQNERCGATEGEALGHKWDAATCTAAKTCSVCKATEGNALGHKWVNATCTAPKTCSVCKATEGNALGHKWTDATCTAPKTCSACKATEGNALGHKWTDATCTAPKTCSVCKATEGAALGHKWTDATCTTAKTCSVCKATEGEALGHKWEAATCTAPKTCSVCNATEGEALGHTWVEANCTTAKTCSVCSATEGNALGHTWVEANCTTAKTCSVCSATEGNALGHTWVEANCTTAKTCSVCSATEGEALGHKWEAATCTAPKTCSVCKATEGEKLAHTFGDWETTKEPTTKEEGEDTRKCGNCDATETRPIEVKADYTWLIITVILVLAAAGIVVVVVLKKKRK